MSLLPSDCIKHTRNMQTIEWNNIYPISSMVYQLCGAMYKNTFSDVILETLTVWRIQWTSWEQESTNLILHCIDILYCQISLDFFPGLFLSGILYCILCVFSLIPDFRQVTSQYSGLYICSYVACMVSRVSGRWRKNNPPKTVYQPTSFILFSPYFTYLATEPLLNTTRRKKTSHSHPYSIEPSALMPTIPNTSIKC